MPGRERRTAPAPGGAPDEDLRSTRDRLLDAGLVEFSERGIAGARVEEICRRANANVKLLYYYFGSKEGLYRELLERVATTAEGRWPETRGDSLHLLDTFDAVTSPDNRPWMRLMLWEELEKGRIRQTPDEAKRVDVFKRARKTLAAAQREQRLPPDIDPADLQLAQLALATFPFVMSGMVEQITGLSVDDHRFLKRWTALLAYVAGGGSLGVPRATERSTPG